MISIQQLAFEQVGYVITLATLLTIIGINVRRLQLDMGKSLHIYAVSLGTGFLTPDGMVRDGATRDYPASLTPGSPIFNIMCYLSSVKWACVMSMFMGGVDGVRGGSTVRKIPV